MQFCFSEFPANYIIRILSQKFKGYSTNPSLQFNMAVYRHKVKVHFTVY